jgi:hypothetical protein
VPSANGWGRLGGSTPKRVALLALAFVVLGAAALTAGRAILLPSTSHTRTVSKEYAGSTGTGSTALPVRLFVQLPYDVAPSARLVLGDATVPLQSVTFDEAGCTLSASGMGQENGRAVKYTLEGHPTEGYFEGILRRDTGATDTTLFLPLVGRSATGC